MGQDPLTKVLRVKEKVFDGEPGVLKSYLFFLTLMDCHIRCNNSLDCHDRCNNSLKYRLSIIICLIKQLKVELATIIALSTLCSNNLVFVFPCSVFLVEWVTEH